MTKHRVSIKQYSGNGQFLGAGVNQYCWGHKDHRPTLGGGLSGKLRLWYCADCLEKRAAAKAAKTITAGNGTTQETNNG